MPRFFHLFWKKGGAKKLSDILGSNEGEMTLKIVPIFSLLRCGASYRVEPKTDRTTKLEEDLEDSLSKATFHVLRQQNISLFTK